MAAFCRREYRRLVDALDLVCGSLPTAEDLAQETLARVCKDWQRISRMDAPGAYAHRIAINLAMSRFRRRQAEQRARVRLRSVESASWHDPDSAAAVSVRAALQCLRPPQRRVLVLRYFLDYSVTETADLLGMPVSTVKTHAARGLAVLRSELGTSVTAEDVAVGSA